MFTEYHNSNTFSRNSENKEDLYEDFMCQGITFIQHCTIIMPAEFSIKIIK